MSKKKRIDVIALRTLRKTSFLTGRVLKKGSSLLDKVENKTSRIIINKTGSPDGVDSLPLDLLLHGSFPVMTPIHPSLPQIGQKPSVTVFVPSLTPRGFYGGIATLLIVSARLANKLGYDYRIVQTSGFEKATSVLPFLSSNGINIDPSRFSTIDVSYRHPGKFAYLPLHQDDVVVVSAWWDAHVASMLPLKKKFIYMIQDYEPIFYSNGDEQQFAEATYHTNNFLPLCNTEILYKFFKDGKYSYITDNATWFEPAVAKVPDNKKHSANVKKIFLYGRPSVTRNMFFTALKALDKALASEEMKQFKWEIYSAGQSDVPSIRFKSGNVMKNLGKMSLSEYYSFAQSIDITISPMLAPHPNYPTLELASLGSMVVSTKYKTKQNLDRYSKNILLCDPFVDDMASKIILAATTPDEVRLANLTENNILSNWPDALSDPLDSLIKKINS